MAWDNLTSNQTISFSNLANAVNTQVFTQKTPIPTTSEQITKTDANTYVNINTSYTPYSNKSSNQLVVQSNLQQTTFCAENGGFGNGYPDAILVLNNQTILVGGSFDYYSGTSAPGLVNLYQGGVLNVNFPYGVISASTISGVDEFNEFVQLPDGKILCAGAFNKYLNTSIPSCLLKLNEDGTRDSSFPNATYGFEQFLGPNTYSLRVDSNGKIYYLGRYSTYNATSRNNIARLNSDGSLDTSFNPGTGFNDSTHDALAQSTGNVVIIGIFDCFNGNCFNKNGIVRLTSTGSLDATFNSGTGFGGGASGYKGYVYNDDKILIGGSFTSYNGTSINNMVKLNSDGTIDTSFNIGSGFNNYVYNLEVDSNGKIYAVGNFTTFNGTSINKICRLNSDGSLDTSFNPGSGANGTVTQISLLDNGLIIIGGSFNQFDGISAIGIAMLSPSGAVLSCGYPSPTPTPSITPTPTPIPYYLVQNCADGATQLTVNFNGTVTIGNVYQIYDPTCYAGFDGVNCWEVLSTSTNAADCSVLSTGVEHVSCSSCLGYYSIGWSFSQGASSGDFSISVNGSTVVSTTTSNSGTINVSPGDYVSVGVSSGAQSPLLSEACLTVNEGATTLYDNCTQGYPFAGESYGPYYPSDNGSIQASSYEF